MAHEEIITAELERQFPFLVGHMRIARERRIFAEVAYEKFSTVFEYVVRSLHFSHLVTITGLDEGEKLGVIYHLSRSDGTMFNIKTRVPKDHPQVESVTPMFPGSVLYEQELVDLFGFVVNGMPPRASRYPLQDDWPAGQYPLRKDWSPEMLEGACPTKKGL